MASISSLSFLKSRLYAKSRLLNMKFHFDRKILFLKSRLYVKSRFTKSRLDCTFIYIILFYSSISLFPSCFIVPFFYFAGRIRRRWHRWRAGESRQWDCPGWRWWRCQKKWRWKVSYNSFIIILCIYILWGCLAAGQAWEQAEMGEGPVGRWGGKFFFDHFFPFYENLANLFAIFIILSFQFEIFMGVPPTVNHLKFLWWGVTSKFMMGVPPPSPPVPISGNKRDLLCSPHERALKSPGGASPWVII